MYVGIKQGDIINFSRAHTCKISYSDSIYLDVKNSTVFNDILWRSRKS